MKRAHRRWHRRLWLVLPVLVLLGFGAALAFRPPPTPEIATGAP
jgi:uncharacterized protein involved in exopolysaccharide biosynthesis